MILQALEFYYKSTYEVPAFNSQTIDEQIALIHIYIFIIDAYNCMQITIKISHITKKKKP